MSRPRNVFSKLIRPLSAYDRILIFGAFAGRIVGPAFRLAPHRLIVRSTQLTTQKCPLKYLAFMAETERSGLTNHRPNMLLTKILKVGLVFSRKLIVANLLAVSLMFLASCVHTPARLPAGNFVTVDGARLWYISEGKGEPIVIISGGPGAAHYLYPFFEVGF